MLSCTAQTYFFLRHSLHNTGNGFIWFLVFLIKSKALKEKVFLLHFTFFFLNSQDRLPLTQSHSQDLAFSSEGKLIRILTF